MKSENNDVRKIRTNIEIEDWSKLYILRNEFNIRKKQNRQMNNILKKINKEIIDFNG